MPSPNPDVTVLKLDAEPEDTETEEGSADPLAPLELLGDALAGIGRAVVRAATASDDEAEDTDATDE